MIYVLLSVCGHSAILKYLIIRYCLSLGLGIFCMEKHENMHAKMNENMQFIFSFILNA